MRRAHPKAVVERRDCDDLRTEDLLATILSGREASSLSAHDALATLLKQAGGVTGLAHADEAEIAGLLGCTKLAKSADATARVLAAVFALGRRVAVEEAAPPVVVARSEDAAAWGIPRLGGLKHEELWLLALDGRCRLRTTRCVARGGIQGLASRAADTIRIAVRTNATGFVLVHNHPSGDTCASREDRSFTAAIAAAAAIVGIPLLDHVIVTRDGFGSVPFDGGSA